MNRSVLLVHHAARRQHTHPPNSLRALQVCLEAEARAIEVDISPLADVDFALLHGPSLDGETTGSGTIGACAAEQALRLRYLWHGVVTDEPVGLLSQALELLRDHPRPVELQLDLKPHVPLTEGTLSDLVAMLEPLKDRIRVTSVADWAQRRLRALDADLALGFDPLLYLDIDTAEPRDPAVPPFRTGAYGYWDEHPLASRRWGASADYLAARAEALWAQAPAGALWYVAAPLLAQALDDGFDWIADLHHRGAEVAAWTLDAAGPGHIALARKLVLLGIDRMITNDAPALARALDSSTLC